MINTNIKKISRKKKVVTGIVVALIIALLAVGIHQWREYRQKEKLKEMDFNAMIKTATADDDGAIITVGTVFNGKMEYKLYGKNGKSIPQKAHIYEIASVSKTFTSALLYKAIGEGKISLDDTIDKYLKLPPKNNYPTIRKLLTHTSGYDTNYLVGEILEGFGGNPLSGVTTQALVEQVGKIKLEDKEYPFHYSNYGISILGAVLEQIYGKPYEELINEFIAKELKLTHTGIFYGAGDLDGYWQWKEGDGYMPAAAIESTMPDMLSYASVQINGIHKYINESHFMIGDAIPDPENDSEAMVRIDGVGGAWLIDNRHEIIWHNGISDNYNCYLGFDKNKKLAVVVLSNRGEGKGVSATDLGVRKMLELQKKWSREQKAGK